MGNMKKSLSLLLTAVMSLGLTTTAFATSNASNAASNAAPKVEPVILEKAKVEKGAIVKVGLGNNASVKKSKEFSEKGATAQADIIFAAVGLDKDGKIVAVNIDNAQTKVLFNADGTLKTDVKEEPKTKRELGDAYGMKEATTMGLEWYQQMDNFEAAVIGKTIDEVLAMPVYEKDPNHPAVLTDLAASVTISVEGYQAALKDAVERAIEVDGADNIGLGISVSTKKSKAKAETKGAVAQMDNTAALVAVKDGKVAKVILDVLQPKVEYNEDGTLKTDVKAVEIKSKKVLGDAYGMKEASGIKKEWWEQANAIEAWMEGKTLEEVLALPVEDKEDKKVATGDLAASVTVGVADYLKVFEEAFNNAK